jgi:hypothetical protein
VHIIGVKTNSIEDQKQQHNNAQKIERMYEQTRLLKDQCHFYMPLICLPRDAIPFHPRAAMSMFLPDKNAVASDI